MPPEAPRCRGYGPTVAAAAGGLHGAPRERVFAARDPAAARPCLHDRRDRPRRRRRPAGDRRPQRADRPLHAGRPDGRQCRRGNDGNIWPGRTAAAGEPVRGGPRPPASIPHVASRTPPCRCRRRRRRAPARPCRQLAAAPRRRSNRPRAGQTGRRRGSRAPRSSRPSRPRRRFCRRRRCRRCRGWSEGLSGAACETGGHSRCCRSCLGIDAG